MDLQRLDLLRETAVYWSAFLAGLVLLALLTIVIVRARRRHRRPALIREAIQGEEGMSYTLPFVLLLPFYLFFVVTVFEIGFLFLAKLGTMYAAHAGARSAVVWLSAQPEEMREELREERIRQAVHTAMAPFASGNRSDVATAGQVPSDAPDHANEFVEAYFLYSVKSLQANPTRHNVLNLANNYNRGSLRSKYLCAAARTMIEINPGTGEPNSDVTVTVKYRAPLHVPVVGRWLDKDRVPPFEFLIISTATLPSEAPRSSDRTLGIKYQSR